MSDGDRAGEFGPIYVPALQRIRNVWVDLEPLVDDTRFDSVVSPTTLHIALSDGIGEAETARIDVQWSELGMYSFHYADGENVNWRFDRHPNTHSPEKHFHVPPGASSSDAEDSCIQVTEVSLVARAVHALWREAYETGECDRLNSRPNPP